MNPPAVDSLEQVIADLREVETYFAERADAEYFTDSPAPVGNEEMRLLVIMQTAIAALRPVGGSERLRDRLKQMIRRAYHCGRNGFFFDTGSEADSFLDALASPQGAELGRVTLPAYVENMAGFPPEVVTFNNIRNACIDEFARLNGGARQGAEQRQEVAPCEHRHQMWMASMASGSCKDCGTDLPATPHPTQAASQGDAEELAVLRAGNARRLNQLEQATTTISGLNTAIGALSASASPAGVQAAQVSDAVRDSIQHVRDMYPVDLWPEHGESLDCKSARMARLTCNNIEREFKRRMEEAAQPEDSNGQ